MGQDGALSRSQKKPLTQHEQMNSVLNRLTQENWESINGAFGPYVATVGTDATRPSVMNASHTIAKFHWNIGPVDAGHEINEQNSRACAAVPVMLRALVRVVEDRKTVYDAPAAVCAYALAQATGSESTEGAAELAPLTPLELEMEKALNDWVAVQPEAEIFEHDLGCEGAAEGCILCRAKEALAKCAKRKAGIVEPRAELEKLRRQVAELRQALETMANRVAAVRLDYEMEDGPSAALASEVSAANDALRLTAGKPITEDARGYYERERLKASETCSHEYSYDSTVCNKCGS